jgi:hypothetical protein
MPPRRSGWTDFDNDGLLEGVQATGFLRGETNRWPELQALGTGNDQLMHNPRNWPAFKAGDDLSGANLNAFFVRTPDGRYCDVGPQTIFAEPMVSRGISIADVDGDGRPDFAVANQWQDSFFFHNQTQSTGAYIGLHLLLPLEPGPTRARTGHPGPDTPGRPAVGAAATIRLPDGRILTAQVDGGSGHSGKRAPEIHMGLGHLGAGQPVEVQLVWRDPSGRMHREKTRLPQRWNTVVLGWSGDPQ